MKIIIISVLILLNNSVLSASVLNREIYSTSENDSAMLLKLETDFTIALVKNDKLTFEKLLAPDFIYTENENTISRSEMLESLMSGHDKIKEAYNKDMVIHLFGSTGIVTGWMTVKGSNPEGSFEHTYRFTDTWIKINGSWQIIAGHDYLMR